MNREKVLYMKKNPSIIIMRESEFIKAYKKEWKEVLDIGCSSGALGATIKENGTRVSGIEAFPEAAEKAKERLDHVILGDIEK